MSKAKASKRSQQKIADQIPSQTHQGCAALPPRAAKAASTRDRILEAATRLFLEEGYASTSLDSVAIAAKVTKPTVYSHFRSKKGLFDAVIQQNTRAPLAQLKEALAPSDDPVTDLTRFGDFFLARVLSREKHNWDRLAASEALNHPEVGESFYRAGPEKVLKALIGLLNFHKKAGRLSVRYPDRAAEQFIGLLLCMDLLRTQIGQPPPTAANSKRRCREAVEVFMASYGATS